MEGLGYLRSRKPTLVGIRRPVGTTMGWASSNAPDLPTFSFRPDPRLLMCRNIKILFNFEPPVTDDEVRAAALQFVRKISGFNQPSKANEASFLAAVEEITLVSRRLLHSLETSAPPKNREEEAAKARARALQRYGT